MKSLKPGKRGWTLIITTTLTVLIIVFSVIYFQQLQRYGQMKEQYAQTQKSLEQVRSVELVGSKTEFETELRNITWQLELAEEQLSIPVESSSITKTLFDIAESHNLAVNRMTSSIPVAENIEGVDLFRTTLTARAEGNYDNFINFIIDLDAHFTTGVIRSVSMVMPGDMDEGIPAVDFEMDIYTAMR